MRRLAGTNELQTSAIVSGCRTGLSLSDLVVYGTKYVQVVTAAAGDTCC